MNIKLNLKKKVVYPSKTQLNMAMKEKHPLRPSRLIPALLILVLLLGLFSKFAVINRLAALDQAENQLFSLALQRDALRQATAEYPEISKAYARLSTDWMTEEMKQSVPCSDALDLLEQTLAPSAKLTHASLSQNLLVVEFEKLDLNLTAALVEQLYALPNVTSVLVQQGSSESPKQRESTIYFLITMAAPEPQQAAAADPTAEEGGAADDLS